VRIDITVGGTSLRLSWGAIELLGM